MKFAHISDTHIKNLKYHYEYRVVFEQLYETLREQEVDYIIHCGDIAHTKTQISPEFVELCSDRDWETPLGIHSDTLNS